MHCCVSKYASMMIPWQVVSGIMHVWYVLNFTIIIGGSFDNGRRGHLIGTSRLGIIVTITRVD